jgi:formate-nitrite transporter family protein
MSDDRQDGMTDAERADVDELAAPRARIIYEVIRRQGDDELARPVGSLFWSGLAAGIAIMTCVVAQGAFRHKLPPDMPARQVISSLGYSLGFLMVMLGRMQLFTEQTIVAVLPNMARPGWRKLAVTARLWAVVFAANMLGACFAAAINIRFELMGHELTQSMLEVSSPLLGKTALDMLLQGVPAGFLVASVAWIRAGMSSGEFWLILALTYAIALGDFAHVVAGSAEAFLLVFAGQTGVSHAVAGIILPSLAGNVIGGTGLFALLAHAQVRQEV